MKGKSTAILSFDIKMERRKMCKQKKKENRQLIQQVRIEQAKFLGCMMGIKQMESLLMSTRKLEVYRGRGTKREKILDGCLAQLGMNGLRHDGYIHRM